MFTELHKMAQAATLLITAAADGEQLRVSISPSYPDGKVPAGAVALRPLSLVGTPDELDAGFAAALSVWQAPKRSIIEQAQDQADEQDEEADAPKATGKITKASDKKASSKPARKSAPAAAPAQDNANAQPEGDASQVSNTERTDAERADEIVRAHAERMAEPVNADSDDADPADPAPGAPAPAGEPALPVVDVHTLDLF